ncbi:MAG TPA: carbonic anhydrase [Pseudolabrys sp.]|nr:carbonic anhydrase [Pseudolabrys sp.]
MTQTTIVRSSTCTCCGDLLRARFDRRRFLHLSAGAGLMAAFPSLAFAASGNYEAMLLTCIDPRFPEPTIKYMEGRHMVGQYSQFSIAGASIGVVAPAFKTWAPAFWDNLAASMQLHNIPKVIAMNHRDCGAAKIAYGEAAVKDMAAETATHKAALMEFKKQVGEKQPKLNVELGLMALDGKVEMFG